jgi:hypothetical protein
MSNMQHPLTDRIAMRISAYSLALCLSLACPPALAQSPTSDLVTPFVNRITEDGFEVQSVKKTWLGRIVITATGEGGLREVVLHGRSGEVLRDRVFSQDKTRPAPPSRADRPDRPPTDRARPQHDRPERARPDRERPDRDRPERDRPDRDRPERN